MNKAAFANNAFNREFMLGKTFGHGARAAAEDVR